MKIRLPVLALVLGVLAASAVLAACGDENDTAGRGMSQRGLTPEEYFLEVQPLIADLNTRFQETDAQLEAYDDLDVIKEAFPEYLDALDGLVTGLRRILPPDELALAHQDLEDAAVAYRDAYERATAVVNRAFSLDDVGGVTGTDEFIAAEGRFVGGCRSLQLTADTNEIAVDLACPPG